VLHVRERPAELPEAVDSRRISSNAQLSDFAIGQLGIVVEPELNSAVPLSIYCENS
jgi:hypothetical protein